MRVISAPKTNSTKLAALEKELKDLSTNLNNVTASIEEAERNILSKTDVTFWQAKLDDLREDKKQLRRKEELLLQKEEQLRELEIVNAKQSIASCAAGTIVIYF